MAEDGMILNFAPTPSNNAHLPAQQKFRGGSWKERLSAKNAARGWTTGKEYNAQKSVWKEDSVNTIPVVNDRTDDFPNPRPTKRRRENGPEDERREVQSRPSNRKPQANEKRPLEKVVVSSLFTSNPKPSAPIQKANGQEAEDKPSAPSNAPLLEGIDTFTTLGLTPSVAAHLLTKMELKNPTAIQRAAITQMLAEEGDVFIQSETGSGKTLAYLLPVVEKIMKIAQADESENRQLSSLHRDSGLFAVILAPTRELCKQISVVLERLLGCANYIVAGTVIGGEKKKSEKARLRKGINILVATPGRLVDHLDNTEVLEVGQVRWLVLDEGDRLMDMGFEEDIGKIVKLLDQKKRKGVMPGLPDFRTTILCSATLKMNVQKLGDVSLKNATLVRGENDKDRDDVARPETASSFLAPAQLKQSYLVSPAKLRLVTLTGLLKRTFARKGSVMKAIVFLSCADSVDFHFKALTRPAESGDTDHSDSSDAENTAMKDADISSESIGKASMLAQDLTLYRLHGSLPQVTRTAIVKAFANSTKPSLLLATDVASRGLDLPNLDLVIEYDPAFSSDDHLHRIGRTARLGRDGRATIFLTPGKEEGYVNVLRSSFKTTETGSASVTQTDADDVLRKGFAPATGVVAQKQKEWEIKATDWQLDVERWVLADNTNHELAKKAFQSHVRAYATHVAAERKYFDIKELHLGHLAKAFGLRDAPANLNMKGMRGKSDVKGKRRHMVDGKENRQGGSLRDTGRNDGQDGIDRETEDAAKKMRDVVRNRKMMMGGGADEFNLA